MEPEKAITVQVKEFHIHEDKGLDREDRVLLTQMAYALSSIESAASVLVGMMLPALCDSKKERKTIERNAIVMSTHALRLFENMRDYAEEFDLINKDEGDE